MRTRDGVTLCSDLYNDLMMHLERNQGRCERQLLVTVLQAYGFTFRTSGSAGRDFVIHPDAPHLQGTLEAGQWLTPRGAQAVVDAVRAARTLLNSES